MCSMKNQNNRYFNKNLYIHLLKVGKLNEPVICDRREFQDVTHLSVPLPHLL